MKSKNIYDYNNYMNQLSLTFTGAIIRDFSIADKKMKYF